jgi:hypothetical protein
MYFSRINNVKFCSVKKKIVIIMCLKTTLDFLKDLLEVFVRAMKIKVNYLSKLKDGNKKCLKLNDFTRVKKVFFIKLYF